jgi:hypothetical protein
MGGRLRHRIQWGGPSWEEPGDVRYIQEDQHIRTLSSALP